MNEPQCGMMMGQMEESLPGTWYLSAVVSLSPVSAPLAGFLDRNLLPSLCPLVTLLLYVFNIVDPYVVFG